jgi:hypothetical protein
VTEPSPQISVPEKVFFPLSYSIVSTEHQSRQNDSDAALQMFRILLPKGQNETLHSKAEKTHNSLQK